MNTLLVHSKSDLIGAVAGALCLVHCVATPFLFVVQAGLVEHGHSHPLWWGLLDIVFLGISFAAVWWSGKMTSKKWMRNALWVSWVVLALIVGNEKFSWLPIAEQAIYAPTVALVLLHLYNRKYCHCQNDASCIEK
ncbi:MerC domain-containing protein [Flagellimonas lutaonensis]|uniref:Membrane protein n=1 Tax=Flagellimonas lutaonensis TaxID=516051 RepID=A0A0D5YWI1_9FLAO|nr:MerC domain-containing protein [Allomuricauda lutaonensis]AKA36254.1 membrane protein [Allomuricauda lutaonensis]